MIQTVAMTDVVEQVVRLAVAKQLRAGCMILPYL